MILEAFFIGMSMLCALAMFGTVCGYAYMSWKDWRDSQREIQRIRKANAEMDAARGTVSRGDPQEFNRRAESMLGMFESK